MKSKKLLFKRGQGIVEYILITAFVALAATAMFRAFRSDIQEAYEKVGDALIQSVTDNLNPNTGTGE